MRALLIALLFLSAPLTVRPADAPPQQYDALVVVHIEGFGDAQLAALSTHIGTERGISLEYACTWAGIVVLRFEGTTAGDKADVTTLVSRHLREAGITKGFEVKHVHVRATGTGKC